MKAICTRVGEYSGHVVVLPMPMETSRSVPMNSASSAFHMLRLSVMSATPMIFFSPAGGGGGENEKDNVY